MKVRTWAGGVAVLGVLAAGLDWWQVNRTVTDARAEIASEQSFPFTATALERLPPPNVEYLASPMTYRDGAIYRGRLYLCGPAGLFAEGKEWRVGQQLPPAPLVAMSAGLASDSREPELWIATAGEGLLAFDGGNFRHIRPRDTHKRKLTSVLALSSGRILMGTETAGVLVYDGQMISPLHHELRSGHVTAMAGDDNAVWVGLMGKGLREWRGGEVRSVDRLPDSHVLSITRYGDVAYAGTALGTAAVRNAIVQRVYAETLFAQSVLADANKLVIGTLEQGVVTVPLGSGHSRTYEAPGSTTALIESGGKLIAIGSDGVFDVRSGERLRTSEGAQLTDRNISALAEDGEGRLWAGYFDRGIDIVSNITQHFEDEHLFCINRIVPGPDYTAVATANGLVLLDRDGRKRQVLRRDDGLIANHVTDAVFRENGLVVATPAGITFLEGSTPRSVYAFHGLVNNHVYTLGAAAESLVAGTLGGISVLRDDVIAANYTTANSRLPHNWITAAVRAGGEWWLGTYGAGVVRLGMDGQISSFSDIPKCIVNPNAMLVRDGRVYAGTLEEGLLMYSDGRWQNISDGLPSSNVTALAASRSGMWVGTDNGLVRLK